MGKKNKKIIGFVGETGTGKDTACRMIENQFKEAQSFRFSETLTDALGLFLNEIKKEDQQWLAGALRDRFGEDILARALAKKIEKSNKEIIIMNGMRVEEDYKLVQELGGKVVYITLDAKKRWERVKQRNEKKDDIVSYEKFMEMDRGRSEEQIKKIGRRADFKVENNGTPEDLGKELIKVMEKI